MRLCLFALALLSVPAWAQEDGGGLSIEAFEPFVASTSDSSTGSDGALQNSVVPVASFVQTSPQPTIRWYGWASAFTAIDTRFDSPRGAPFAENVWESRLKAVLGVDLKLNERLRVVLEGRAQVRGASQRDGDRAKGFFEPMLGDAFIDIYTHYVDFRVGAQRVALGANAFLAPADALNPRDLREGVGDLEDSILPVFALRAQGDLMGVSWLAAYVPFFAPHRYFVFGQDEGLLQPGSGVSAETSRIDPSIEDGIQDRLLETQRPAPFLGDVALRVSRPGRVKLGVSWVWMNEKLPRVVLDSELSKVLSAFATQRPRELAATASVLNRLEAGETLFRGTYGRQHFFALEGSALLGGAQLDVDLSFSPRQTFVDAQLNPVDKAAVTWVVGLSQASDSIFTYSVTYVGMAIPNIKSDEQLMLLEPATAAGAPHTSFFHLLVGLVGVQVWAKRFEVSLRASFEPVQKSFALSPRITWQGVDGLRVYVAADVYEGTPWSPFGYFNRNDRVLLGARYDFW